MLLKKKKMTIKVWEKAAASERDIIAAGYDRYGNQLLHQTRLEYHKQSAATLLCNFECLGH